MEQTIHVLLLVVDCHIPHAQSLKQKRAVVKSLIDRLHQLASHAGLSDLMPRFQKQDFLMNGSVL